MGYSQENATTGDTVKPDIFMVTSACMNDYGIYSPEAKFEQLLATLDSISTRSPTADIVLIETSNTPLPLAWLHKLVNNKIDYYQCAGDRYLLWQNAENDPNQFIAKTFGEFVAYNRFFYHLHHCAKTYRRCFKISGRYWLTDNWQKINYDQCDIVVRTPTGWRHSPECFDRIDMIYDSKLWSWHYDLSPEISRMMSEISAEAWDSATSTNQWHVIEMSIYSKINQSRLPKRELPVVGVEGYYGQDGRFASE